MMDDLFAAIPPPVARNDGVYGPPEPLWKVPSVLGHYQHYLIRRGAMISAAAHGEDETLLTLSFSKEPLLVWVNARRFREEMPTMKVTGLD